MKSEDLENYTNRRVSPRGMIDLPFTVRKTLGFKRGEPKYLAVSVEQDSVCISVAEKSAANTVKASPRGLLRLPKEAHEALTECKKGRYILTIDERSGLRLQRGNDYK